MLFENCLSLYFSSSPLSVFMQTMPEAAGAVAAAAVADRLHGSKEDRKLAIILVNIMLLVFYDLHC
jgi:hypothetical protein